MAPKYWDPTRFDFYTFLLHNVLSIALLNNVIEFFIPDTGFALHLSIPQHIEANQGWFGDKGFDATKEKFADLRP